MITWFWIFGLIYLALLVFAGIKSFKKNRSADEFMLAGSSIGVILGFLTYSAALFSAFTFQGMPDFFRQHGIGAWIFLAVSDGAMVFFILWFGFHIRKKVEKLGFKGVAGLIGKCYGTKWAGYALFMAAFVFLIPYAAIQIRGVSIFLHATFPDAMPFWGWSIIIIGMMLVYSEIGGLKAIVYADAIQGLTLLCVIWIIGLSCVAFFGGIEAMFEQVEKTDKALLSSPGPNGLFTVQFLLSSMIAIVLLPVTQPQFTTRIVVMKSQQAMHKMAVGVGTFAILVILPTSFIGMYGAVRYAGASIPDFLSQALLFDQANVVAALANIGLFAAVLSTVNAQIFALGSELRSLLQKSERKNMMITKVSIFLFAILALGFSLISGDQLVLLARVSFAGTGTMGALVLAGVLSKRKPGIEILIVSTAAFFIFLASVINLIPSNLLSVRLDLLLFICIALTAIVSIFIRSKQKQ
jgi:SSS family solute:Na+ symporter